MIIIIFCDLSEEQTRDSITAAQAQDVIVNIDEPDFGEDAPEKPDAQVRKNSLRKSRLSHHLHQKNYRL